MSVGANKTKANVALASQGVIARRQDEQTEAPDVMTPTHENIQINGHPVSKIGVEGNFTKVNEMQDRYVKSWMNLIAWVG